MKKMKHIDCRSCIVAFCIVKLLLFERETWVNIVLRLIQLLSIERGINTILKEISLVLKNFINLNHEFELKT